jgi:hypothetical protein
MKYSSLLAATLLAASLAGCGSGNKEGTVALGDVAKVDEATCAQCHGSAREKLTGRVIYEDYAVSVHALNSVGCQDCHGGGAEHNGVGPIPFPKPNYNQCRTCHNTAANAIVTNYSGSKHLGVVIEEDAPCNRCHTHQGAVLAAQSSLGFTGDGDVLAAGETAGIAPGTLPAGTGEPIKCNTCHVTHNPKELRIDAKWNPSTTPVVPTVLPTGADGKVVDNTANGQYRLCTQCHTYINPAGKVAGSGTAASGTVKVGHHETSWYRAIATTHFDTAAATGDPITGYGVRTTGADPCFDCHGHEGKTNTNNDPASTSFNSANTTIYTDWAQSGHAGGLLTAKFAAARANPVNTTLARTNPTRVAQGLAQVDAVMAASVDPGVWNEHNSGGCNRCHNASGFVAILATPAGTAQPVTTKGQVLTCWGCHSDAANGTLRTLAGTTFTNYTGSTGWNPIGYALNYGKKPYPDVKASNLCIECHDSREKDPGAITAASTTYQRTHYLQAAATMYVKMGFLNLSTGASGVTGAAYLKSLKSSQDVAGGITSTHRKLGTPAMVGDHGITAADTDLLANGPCVACHFASKNHTLTIDQRTITAVCNKCHDSEGGHAITTIADFRQYFLEPQSEAYQAALKLAIDTFNAKNTGITLAAEPSLPQFVRAYTTASLAATPAAPVEAVAADWTAAMTVLGPTYNKTKILGAVSNIVFFKREPAAYAHARTYSRRLIYDTIDYLDNGTLDMSVGATAVATSPTVFGKGTKAFTDGTLTTLSTGTTEAMTFLIKWSRTDGTWSSPQRP